MKINVSSRLSPQWLCGNLCTWAHHIYYAHLASVRCEHYVCRESLRTTYIYIYTNFFIENIHKYLHFSKKNRVKRSLILQNYLFLFKQAFKQQCVLFHSST